MRMSAMLPTGNQATYPQHVVLQPQQLIVNTVHPQHMIQPYAVHMARVPVAMQPVVHAHQAPALAAPAPAAQTPHVAQQPAERRKPQNSRNRRRPHQGMRNERPCEHNSWDNVRVVRKKMTLRCRVCQQQWRAQVELVWKQWKCELFATHGKCAEGDACDKLHLHYRKQGLDERVTHHGESLLKGRSLPAKADRSDGVTSTHSFTSAQTRNASKDSPGGSCLSSQGDDDEEVTTVATEDICFTDLNRMLTTLLGAPAADADAVAGTP